jgi:hypothetical protein
MTTLANASAVNALEASNSTFKGPSIEAGLYPAVIVGVQAVTTTYEGKTKGGYRFIFQYEDDENNRYYLASKQFDLNFYEKSNFAKMFTSWTSCQNTPEAIFAMLEKGKFLDEQKNVVWANFLGKHTALMLSLKASKKDPEKFFVNLESYHAPTKKTGRIDPKPEDLPWFLGEIYGGSVDDAIYADGFKIGEKKQKEDDKDEVVEDAAPKKAPKPKTQTVQAPANLANPAMPVNPSKPLIENPAPAPVMDSVNLPSEEDVELPF